MATTNRRFWRGFWNGLNTSYSVQRVWFTQGKLLSKAKTIGSGKISRVLQAYEDIVGLSEVRSAQENVIKAEEDFLEVQEERRAKQFSLAEIHTRLRSVMQELGKTEKDDKRRLNLIRKENNFLGELQNIEQQIARIEQSEKDKFALLSVAVRVSHDKERAKAKRTRTWSIIGSAVGATVGIIGTSVNDYFRMKELRSMIKNSNEQSFLFREMESEQSDTTKCQFTRIEEQLGELHSTTSKTAAVEKHTKEILNIVKHQDSILEEEKEENSISSIIKVSFVFAGVALGVTFVVGFFKSS